MNSLKIVNFKYLSEDKLLDILSLRNSDRVRLNMANSELIPAQEHLSYCKTLSSRKDVLYFAVYVNNFLEGVLDFKAIDFNEQTYESGSYFIENSKYNISYYANIAGFLIARSLKLATVSCFVYKNNMSAMLLNTCKLKYKIVKEDHLFYYLNKDLSDKCFDSDKYRNSLNRKFSLEISI